ncbi:MAG: GyrI-like domain-containing protein [Candidatus Aminicenantaceae bacterium]
MKKTTAMTLIFFLISSFTLILSFQEKTSETITVSVKEVAPFTYCCITHKGPFSDIETVIGRLIQEIKGQNLFPRGPMIGIYYNSPEEVKPEELKWEIGFPITPQSLVLAPLVKKQWSFTTVAAAIHTGSYESVGQTYPKIFKWMQMNHYMPAGPIAESYLDQDPSKVKPEELRTEIWIPCKKIKE